MQNVPFMKKAKSSLSNCHLSIITQISYYMMTYVAYDVCWSISARFLKGDDIKTLPQHQSGQFFWKQVLHSGASSHVIFAFSHVWQHV